MIRECDDRDVPVIDEVINQAATAAYKGKIPSDCWHEPYMSPAELRHEISSGVRFWAWEEGGEVLAVMGLQHVAAVALIRHAYVRPEHQKRGLGGRLLQYLSARTERPLLIGTWADAAWAI